MFVFTLFLTNTECLSLRINKVKVNIGNIEVEVTTLKKSGEGKDWKQWFIQTNNQVRVSQVLKDGNSGVGL